MAVATGTALAAMGIGSAVASIAGGARAGSAANSAAQIQAQAGERSAQDSMAAAQQAGDLVAGANDRTAGEIRSGRDVANDQITAQLAEIIRANGVYSDAGQRALAQLETLYGDGGAYAQGFNAEALKTNLDPGYQFRLEQGQRGIESSAAARGSVLSTRAQREMARFNSGLASQEIAAAFGRYADTRNARTSALQNIVGVGQTATGQTNQARAAAGAGTSANTMAASQQIASNDLNSSIYRGNALLEGTNQATQARTGAANALAAGRVGSANAMNQGISGAINAGLGAYSIYADQQNGGRGGYRTGGYI